MAPKIRSSGLQYVKHKDYLDYNEAKNDLKIITINGHRLYLKTILNIFTYVDGAVQLKLIWIYIHILQVDVLETVVEVVEPVRGRSRGRGRGIIFSKEYWDSLRRSKRSKPSLD